MPNKALEGHMRGVYWRGESGIWSYFGWYPSN